MLLALDLDDAHPARPEAGQLRLVAERRDLDPVVAADLEDRLALEALDDAPVDLDPDPRRRLRPLRRLGREQALGDRVGDRLERRLGASGRVIRSAISSQWAAPAATAIGRQTPAGQVLRRMCSSSSDRKYRIPLAYGSVASRSWSHSAERDDVGRQVGQELEVRRARHAGRDPVADLADPARPDPAGDRLAACLVGAEPGQEPGQVDDAGALVGDDDGARADVGAGGAEGVELVRRVEQVRRQQAARRAADEDGLDAAWPSPARRDDLAERRPERHLRDAAAGRTADADEDRARARLRADRGERLGAVDEDPRHRGEGLDVLDDGRHAEQAALRRMRRPLLGLAALALERLQEDRLLAEHVGALDRPDRDRRRRGRSRACPGR